MIQGKTIIVSSLLAIKFLTDRPMSTECWPTTLMTPKLKFYILIEQYTKKIDNQVKIMEYNA